MGRILSYPGVTDIAVLAMIVIFLTRTNLAVATVCILAISLFRVGFYVAFSRAPHRLTTKRASIKILLMILPIPYLLMRSAPMDWRSLIALYISISTFVEFSFITVKWILARRLK